MTTICRDDARREAVRARPELNGLDYVEVGDDQITLTVYFLGKAPQSLTKGATQFMRVEGGRRIRNIKVIDLDVVRDPDPEFDDYAVLRLDKAGDFSTYILQLIGIDNIDPFYDHLTFSFKVNCPNDLDCASENVCPPDQPPEPEIDYLAKDYASFRQLLLDRLALIMPDWQERHVPDIGLTLVELLAYVGDNLSYYQDAVATEAYLNTARQRISVRRHARLVDYVLHEGCNARAWLSITTETDWSGEQALNPHEVYFITSMRDMAMIERTILAADDLRNVPPSAYEPFEAMTDQPIDLYAFQSRIFLYTWGERECCLPRGTTAATLIDGWDTSHTEQSSACMPPRKLHLKMGDTLIFEEVLGPASGQEADADPAHRHAVRLTKVMPGEDPLNGQPVVEVEWSCEDALPFALCLSATTDADHGCQYHENISIAYGNVILVDHGFTIEPYERLGTVPTGTTEAECPCEGHPSDVRYFSGFFRPRLKERPLTYRQPLPADCPSQNMVASATSRLVQNVRQALPQAYLTSILPLPDADSHENFCWVPRIDLLGSGPDDRHFVAEIDNDGVARLRFGDGECGRQPEAASAFSASYRVGNGASGNVGAESIIHMVFRDGKMTDSSLTVSNPLPARGGMDPEPMAEAKLFAPSAFRHALMRAVIAGDYAVLAQREFATRVQRAAAVLAWTGSWYEADVAIDPMESELASPGLLEDIERTLQRYRRMGHDLEVKPARYVPVDLELTVCVLPNHLRGHVKAALLEMFGNRLLPDGRRGFFHPDNLSFGEGLYLSRIIATAQAVIGVKSVRVTKLHRLFEPANRELENGVLPLGPLEVAQLDNDPSFPERGKLALVIQGGR